MCAEETKTGDGNRMARGTMKATSDLVAMKGFSE